MKLVEFFIDNSKYKIECPTKDEKKILSLAKVIDKKAEKLRTHLKNIDDKTLLAILCLTIQDECSSSFRQKNNETSDDSVSEAITQEAIENVSKITKRVENLAKKIERS